MQLFRVARQTVLKRIKFNSPQLKLKHLSSTSDTTMAEYTEVKEKYLTMDLEERRDRYKCGMSNFVPYTNIPTWPEYFAKFKLTPSSNTEGRKEVDEELNNKLSLWRGDITTLEIDCIVNAANKTLRGGGGVDGAIHRAAGPHLLRECDTMGGCEEGKSKLTGGYRLPGKWVIHTVGPQEEKEDVLRSCYETSFAIMMEQGLRSIAFPCIATGIYGYPNEAAAHVALSTTRSFLEKNKEKVDRVVFTTFQEVDVTVYEELMQKYFPI